MTNLGLIHCDETGTRANGKTCWGSHWNYQNTMHAVRCAHLLCELNNVTENHLEQTLAKCFKELLLAMKRGMDKAILVGRIKSVTTTCIVLTRSMTKCFKPPMRKIRCPKQTLKCVTTKRKARC